eukprot:GSChrysophyteH1.ASY1.ANO1.1950.1 assembled CDS
MLHRFATYGLRRARVPPPRFLASGAHRFNSTESTTSSAVEASQSLHPLYESVTSDLVLTNSPPDLVLTAIENLHLSWQIPYWESICILTIAMRVCLLPMGIKMAQSSARMAAVRPLLSAVTDAMKRDPNANQAARKKQYSEQSKALLKQYKVNPFLSLAMPLVQLPIFMSAFFALQKMGDYFPGVETGGVWLFTDLAAADSTMVLPIMNSLSFLMMIELGADGMAANDQAKFKWVMRGLAVFMTPVTMTMPTGVFVYWTTQNMLSVIQATALKLPGARRYFGMPDPPKISASQVTSEENPVMKVVDSIRKEFTKGSDKAEVVDEAKSAMPLVKDMGPAPQTFSSNPKGKGKRRS